MAEDLKELYSARLPVDFKNGKFQIVATRELFKVSFNLFLSTKKLTKSPFDDDRNHLVDNSFLATKSVAIFMQIRYEIQMIISCMKWQHCSTYSLHLVVDNK